MKQHPQGTESTGTSSKTPGFQMPFCPQKHRQNPFCLFPFSLSPPLRRIRRENGQEGYVYSIYLGDNKPDYSGDTHSTVLSREDCIDAFRSAAISYAEGRLGDTYSQERRDTDGYADCSSLVRDAFQNASGVSIGNTTSTQADTMNNYFYSIDQITDATPGDLLYHLSGDHHTGIYLGNGQVLHASQNAGTVTISSYNSDSSYWEYGCNAAAYCYDAGQ